MKAARWAFLGGWAGIALVVALVAWQGVDRPAPGAVPGLDVIYLDARTPAAIVPLDGPEVPPLAYRHAPSLVLDLQGHRPARGGRGQPQHHLAVRG